MALPSAVYTPEASLNLTHLDYLSEVVELDGTPILLTHIYCEADEYQRLDAVGEGIAAVDDVARAALVYLNNWSATGAIPSRERARAALNFVLRMQTAEGECYNFVLDRNGTINTDGITSRLGLDWWTCRALWALARGYAAFRASEPAYAAQLRAAYLRTEGLIARHLEGPRGWRNVGGQRMPGWLLCDSAALSAVAALGLVSFQAIAPNRTTAALLTALADGLAAFSYAGPVGLPWNISPPTFAEVGIWHAWGAHSAEALARAGAVLQRSDWLAAAAREVEGFFAWQLATERLHALDPLPVVEGQQAYGVNGMVQAALALHAATGEVRYARMAGLHASWLFGNNSAAAPLYEPRTGRGFDGVDGGEETYWVNLHSGAESTIEALLALQAVALVPEAARFLPFRAVSSTRWQTLRARNAVLRGVATGPQREAVPVLRGGDTLTWICQIPEAGDYVLYVARPPAAAELHGARGAALAVTIGGTTGSLVSSPARDDGYPWLRLATPEPVTLAAGEQTVRVLIGAAEPDARATIAGVLLHPVTARKTLADPAGRQLHLRYELGHGLCGWDEVASEWTDRS